MILDEYVEIKVSNNVSYYEKLGYKIPRWKNPDNRTWYVKRDTSIKVKVSDLPNSSHTKIKVSCDICGKEKIMSYKEYNRSIKNRGYCTCIDCRKFKAKETFIDRYGYENPFSSEEVREKIKQTMIDKYGVEHPLQNDIILQKTKQTCIDKYGVDNVGKVPEIQEKIRDSNNERYGVDYYTSTTECHEKAKMTCIEKYGKENVSQVPEVREKIHKTMSLNNTCRTSCQQEYISGLYNGKLNVPFMGYSLDIVLDENINIEVDFGGHDLCVKFGNMTQEEFNKKELVRFYQIKRGGYKQIHLVSETDKLPSDKMLLHILDLSKDYFNSTNHTWIEWYFDEQLYRNAENINGSYFNYGELHKVSKQSA